MLLKVSYRRTISLAPYETQEIVLGVEEDHDIPVADVPAKQKLLHQIYHQLDQVGDRLVATIIAKPHPKNASQKP